MIRRTFFSAPRLRRGTAAVLGLALLASLATLAGGTARAADGTTLRQITAQAPACSIGTGLAFDGDRLLLSCWYTSELYAVSPQDGRLLDTLTVSGLDGTGLGALAYDRGRSAIWACGPDHVSVYLLDLDGSSASAHKMFVTQRGCVDGLAYDGTDQTLFTSGDVDTVVYHYRTDGTLVDTRSVSGSLGGCGNSGIAVGGESLFLANNGCSQIYQSSKSTSAAPSLFATFPARIEDMECDDQTFAHDGKAAIWSKDAYDYVLNAFELNVGDCGFGGLPPSSSEKFVYVALGDSYSSGEGVGNSIGDNVDYLTKAYENGANYPQQVGSQVDTYTRRPGGVSDSGDSCHRALADHAKLNRDRLKPGAEVVLVDMTCSGAQIEPAGKPPIVGPVSGSSYAVGSQVDQAIKRLGAAGLSASDVDLVTVGMGGNDAKFGEIVQACLLPNVLRELVKAYPNAPGEIEFVVNQFATCANADKYIFHTDQAIAALGPKLEWGQDRLLDAFPSARILQSDYPDILPAKDVSPDFCGGIRKDDLGFARDKVAAIDDRVRRSVDRAGPRYGLVEVEDLFGSNSLCPGTEDLTLANGIDQSRLSDEINRLLDVDGNGDATARAKLDTLVDRYNEYKSCLAKSVIFLCNRDAALDRLKAAGQDAMTYLAAHQNELVGNLIAAPEGSSTAIRFDRSRGLFHPNANGVAALSCKFLTTYQGRTGFDCIRATSPVSDTVNGNPVPSRPVPIVVNDTLHVVMNGYLPFHPIVITEYSAPQPLGTATADADGTVTTDVRIPPNNAGVHTLEFAGSTATGSAIRKVIRVQYAGRPSGDTYAGYFCGFEPAPEHYRTATVNYAGGDVMTLPIDENGCVLVEVPLLDLPRGPFSVDLKVTEDATGKTSTTQLRPVPRTVGIWAGGSAAALTVSGARAVLQGLVHTDGALSVTASGVTGDAGEYGTTSTVNKQSTFGSLTKVATGGRPTDVSIADYRPGGRAAKRAGTAYHAVAAAQCVNGVWSVRPADVPSGVVYVPCGVNLTASGTVAATLAAEGAVSVGASTVTIRPASLTAPSVVSGSDVRFTASDGSAFGSVIAPAGTVSLAGARVAVQCGIVAGKVDVSGSDAKITVGDACRAG